MFAPDHVARWERPAPPRLLPMWDSILLVVPRLTSRSWVFWTAGTAVATVAIAVYYGITQPENRWAAVLVLAGTAITALGVVSARTWIEPATGTIGRKLFWCLQRRASLGSATSILLVNNRVGGLHLDIKHRRTLYVPVLTSPTTSSAYNPRRSWTCWPTRSTLTCRRPDRPPFCSAARPTSSLRAARRRTRHWPP
jgi:hypothetical protein